MRTRVLAIAIALSLSGCAVQKQLVPTGGSRSDGTVELSFTHTKFEKPQVDGAQGLRAASERCAAWGYQGAEAFGGHKQICQSQDMYGCNQWLVTKQYQCTGANKPQ